MAWTYFPLTTLNLPAKGLQAKEIWQELEDAINERVNTASGTPAQFTVSGTDLGDRLFQASDVAAIQQKVEDLTPNFIDHTDSSGNWDGVAAGSSFRPAWVFGGGGAHDITSSAHANIGGGNGDWTRRHGTAASLSTSYGQMSAGDVAGLFIESSTEKLAPYLNEIHQVLDYLRWTPQGSSTVPSTSNGSARDTRRSITSYADAYANLVDPDAFDIGNSHDKLLHTCDLVNHNVLPQYGAESNSLKGSIRATVIANNFAHSADYYGFAVDAIQGGAIEEWDDDALGYNETTATFLGSSAAETSTFSDSPVIGNDATLQDKPSTDPVGVSEIVTRGWALGDWEVVLKWDVTNGFTKVT